MSFKRQPTAWCLATILIAVVVPDSAPAQTTMSEINPAMQKPMKINLRRVADAGLRTINGVHVTIYTDVPAEDWIEELPEIFDAAVDQWCEYFAVPKKKATAWKMVAFLIRDKQRFKTAGLVPDDLPQFPAGINRGHEIWFFLQPDRYYTRHLLLHEGTHAFMQWFGNGVGAPWYAEGMAELLALHRWKDKELTIHHSISDPRESEGWGRPKLIKDWAAKNANLDSPMEKSLQDLLLTPNRAFENVENYAWCWAACEFLEKHPVSKDHFGKLQKKVHLRAEAFNQEFQKLFSAHLDQLEQDWALFVWEMEYGYLISNAAIGNLKETDTPTAYQLATDRSWQLTPEKVTSGQKFRITATGRFQIGSSRVEGRIKAWPCEARGITIDYFRGRPIGELHATILPEKAFSSLLPFLSKQKPTVIGADGIFTADRTGRLCFRINESPANLADNIGQLKISIEKLD